VRRFSALVLVAMLIGAMPALAATVDISIPVDTIVRGPAGSEHVLAVVEVPLESRAETCQATAVARNQDSQHPDSDLRISSGVNSVAILDVENTANGTVFGGGLITLSDTITVTLTLGPDRVFSGGLRVEIDCPPFNPPSTTTTSTTLITNPPPTGAIGDLVWEDGNADGRQDDLEVGVAGVTVELLDDNGLVLATTATNSDGNYLFAGLAGGTYEVQFALPAGFEVSPLNATDDALDSDAGVGLRTGEIILASGVTDLTWDAGIFKSPAVLPQVISVTTTSTPAEALPFTGPPAAELGEFGAALVAFGSLLVLTLRLRERGWAMAGWESRPLRTGYRGKHRRR
jgi:hypothetical protein